MKQVSKFEGIEFSVDIFRIHISKMVVEFEGSDAEYETMQRAGIGSLLGLGTSRLISELKKASEGTRGPDDEQ